MKKNARIDEKTYNHIRILLEAGSTYDEVHEYLGVGNTTIARIKHADTYDEYRQLTSACAMDMKARRQKAKAVTEQPVKPVATEQPVKLEAKDWYIANKALKALEEQNELLKLISNKLAFIVEQLA